MDNNEAVQTQIADSGDPIAGPIMPTTGEDSQDITFSPILTDKGMIKKADYHANKENISSKDQSPKQCLGDAGNKLDFPVSCNQNSPRSRHSPGLGLGEKREGQLSDVTRKQRLDRDSPDGKKYLKYHSPGKPNMRHQLLVQRTFSPRDEKLEPRTSSPMRKVRVCTETVGAMDCSPIKSVSAYSTSKDQDPSCNKVVPLVLPAAEAAVQSHDVQAIFKTPIRAHHPSGNGSEGHITPSRPILSLFSSPASSGSCLFTPGRHFVNPFEMDSDHMHMPVYSPSVFNIGSATSSAQKKDTAGFWSVEHAALLMPVDIKDSEVHRQLRHQQRLDRERDAEVQSAINTFFSNEVIVPSPWSEKVKHFLPRTPGAVNSVSCQTTLSVPPGVDLLAELGGKYGLSEYKTDPSTSTDSMGSSFIRRKLLNQLNENDSDILSSPVIPVRSSEKTSSSSPSPGGRRQSTPEWEHQTPNKHTSGHFSSSPIREEPDERGHHHALSESDLLASPELSPIAGSTKTRSSAIFYSDQDVENPRAIMQLDFSSILDEDSGAEEEEDGDRFGTLIQRTGTENYSGHGFPTSTDPQASSAMSSQDSEGLDPPLSFLHRKPLLQSALSSESTSDYLVSCSTSGPQLGSSQDTGYNTASLALSSSNLASLEVGTLGWTDHTAGQTKLGETAHTDITSEFTGLKSRPDLNQDSSFSGSGASVKDAAAPGDDTGLPRRREPCLVRKIRALSDVRLSREKKSVSRDLTQSFNMDCSARSHELKRSFNENENGNSSGSLIRSCSGVDVFECIDIDTHGSISLDSSLIKNMPTVFPMVQHVTDNKEISGGSRVLGTNNEKGSQVVNIRQSESTPEQDSESSFRSRFSLGDEDTLEQARQLLGRSEQLRQRHLEMDSLGDDAFHQALMASDENIDPHLFSASASASDQAPPFSEGLSGDTSTSTPRILESLERNICSVKSSRLGSEIATEILKRAEDDLAKVTDILEENSSTPR